MRSISINNLFPPHTWRNLATPALTGKCNNAPIWFQAGEPLHKSFKCDRYYKNHESKAFKNTNKDTESKNQIMLLLTPSLPPYNIFSHILNCNLSESSFKEGSKDTVMSKYMLSPLRRVKNMPSPLNCISDKPSSNPQHRHHSQESILRQQRPQPHPLHISATRTSLTLTENRQTNHARQLLFKIKLSP